MKKGPLVGSGIFRGLNLSTQLYWGLLKKTHPFFEQPVFHGKYPRVLLRSSYGCFGSNTRLGGCGQPAQDAELLRASQRSKADGFNSELQKFAKKRTPNA